jgi:hypothetical protein
MISYNALELGILIFTTVVMAILVLDNFLVRLKNKRLTSMAAQAEIDRLAVYAQVQEILKREAERSESGDGFVKFVSQSRDWAFEYIEDVQRDLSLLKSFIDDNGISPKTVAQTNGLNKILNKLIDHLPKDGKAADV